MTIAEELRSRNFSEWMLFSMRAFVTDDPSDRYLRTMVSDTISIESLARLPQVPAPSVMVNI